MSRPRSRPSAGAPAYERSAGCRRVLVPGSAALLAAGLLLGWNAPPSRAQQSPDTWSDQGRALLPSGLAVQLEFAPAPGGARPGPAAYADGLRPGAPAEVFALTEDRSRADGSWHTLGTLRIAFSRPVRNPGLHVSGLAGPTADEAGSTASAARPTVTGGSPAAPVPAPRTAWTGWTVAANALGPARAEGGAVLCRAVVAPGGAWSCRPDGALGQGPHSLTPVGTTTGGVVLTGDPVRFTVKTGPPAVPLLSLPEFTDDPGLLLTGTGDPGSTVPVTDQAAAGTAAAGTAAAGTAAAGTAELCSTRVGAARTWSCLPVENLPDGTHRLTPAAVDAAGNRATGRTVALVVDTVAPAAPVLSTPAAGETLRTARPRFAGRAEGGTTVTLAVRPAASAAAERVPACSAVAAIDGGWSCAAARDLAVGEHALVVSATDRAGNGTAAGPVTLRVAAPAGAVVTPTPAVASVPKQPSASPAGQAASPGTSAPVAPPSASAPTSGRRVAGMPPPRASSADRAEPASAGPALAVPPSADTVARNRVESTGWRAALAGGLLLLTAVGLITRRLFGRGPGRRRR